MWPPQDREWHDLLQPLPADADRVGVREAVEAAVREYVDDADHDKQHHSLWLEIGRAAGSRQVEKLCRLVLQLENFSRDPVAESLLQLVAFLRWLRTDAGLRAAVYLASTRRGRFMSRLSLAWTGPGRGDLPISEAGPFVDFIADVPGRVLDRPLDSAGVKKFVRRERARRAALRVLDQRFECECKMKVDAFVFDSSGHRKSD